MASLPHWVQISYIALSPSHPIPTNTLQNENNDPSVFKIGCQSCINLPCIVLVIIFWPRGLRFLAVPTDP